MDTETFANDTGTFASRHIHDIPFDWSLNAWLALTIESWKLRDVNTTPQQPGHKAFESKTENFGNRGTPAE